MYSILLFLYNYIFYIYIIHGIPFHNIYNPALIVNNINFPTTYYSSQKKNSFAKPISFPSHSKSTKTSAVTKLFISGQGSSLGVLFLSFYCHSLKLSSYLITIFAKNPSSISQLRNSRTIITIFSWLPGYSHRNSLLSQIFTDSIVYGHGCDLFPSQTFS